MSPIIRTRAQNLRKSGLSLRLPSILPDAPIDKAPRPSVAPTTRPQKAKKPSRRSPFKIEVLADRTSSLNVAQQKKRRRMTTFHPEMVPLITEVTPVDNFKNESSSQTNGKRHRGVRTSPRASLHVRWADNLHRVASISPSPNTSIIQHTQGEQVDGQPRSILRVFHDAGPSAVRLPSDIPSAGAPRGPSGILNSVPLYVLPEIPRGITLHRRRRESRANHYPSSSRSQTLSIDDPPSGPSSATPGECSCMMLRNSTQVPPSHQAIRTTGMTSSAMHGRATFGDPSALSDPSSLIHPTRPKARRVVDSTNNPSPPHLLARTPTARHEGWIRLPANRIDRWIVIFCMFYTPIILPLVLRILGLV